ncbi:MAG: hypothetical protein BRC44_17245 [Cyanobacteria bacterium QS_4_48_99]|nr:MAG: hypothetical protein BRC39_03465 [Cyanobacteria bacterium QH_7_48_89]PSO76017.1 MAG: hypothetical protein BRC44_17245 [Cyanobacteria bacterium QS_4_48_99]
MGVHLVTVASLQFKMKNAFGSGFLHFRRRWVPKYFGTPLIADRKPYGAFKGSREPRTTTPPKLSPHKMQNWKFQFLIVLSKPESAITSAFTGSNYW